MNKNKLISGSTGVLIGHIIMILIIDVLSKPSNVPISLKPIESIQTYFFGFVFTMGSIGWVLGGLVFIGHLTLFYFIGIWVYRVVFKR